MTPLFDSLEESTRKLLLDHLNMVIEANEKLNLTRITSLDEALVLHVEDSLSALAELEDAPEGLYADLGSGAGYPGVPLALATGRKTLLVDARKKKMQAVESMIERLGLTDQVKVFAGRAELLARTRSGEFSAITARALAKLSVLLELASPLLEKGGVLICYKSHIDEDEMKDARRVESMVGMRLKSDRSFKLGEYDRRIVAFEKVGKGTITLPRLEGQAQKNPL